MTRNTDSEGRVATDEATARRAELVAGKVAAAGDAIVEELIVDLDTIDTVELPDGRLVIRTEGVPVYVADVSSLDVDARLVLDEEADELYDPAYLSDDAIRQELAAIAEWSDGSPESGPRELDGDDVDHVASLRDELDRRESVCPKCADETRSRDCFGELRCVECDGPCPGCHDGPGPDELERYVVTLEAVVELPYGATTDELYAAATSPHARPMLVSAERD